MRVSILGRQNVPTLLTYNVSVCC